MAELGDRVIGLRRVRGAITLAALAVLVTGCRTAPGGCDCHAVTSELQARTGRAVEVGDGQPEVPPGATLDFDVGEDEAAALALWNNAAFQELTADLGLARADLVQAGVLPNPEAVFLLGSSVKPWRYAIDLP